MTQPHWLLLVAAIVGAVTGVLSLIVVFFSTGRRIGQLETRLEAQEQKKTVGEREWGELNNKVETLYEIYVVNALSRPRDEGEGPLKRRGRKKS